MEMGGATQSIWKLAGVCVLVWEKAEVQAVVCAQTEMLQVELWIAPLETAIQVV